jgi:hypothetical protein
MGHGVGAFLEKELKHLSLRQRAALKKAALLHLRASPDVHRIIRKDPKLLTKHPGIRKTLRTKLRHRLKSK